MHPCGSRCCRRTRGPIPVGSRATSRRSPPSSRRPATSRASSRPFDPDDALSRAPAPRRAPAARVESPEGFVSLGRTVGIPANGAVSNMALTPHAVLTLRARAARAAATTCCTSTSRSCPVLGWDALCSAGELPLVGTFHTYSENALTNGIAAVAARRAPADEPPARADRRLRGGRLDRAALLRRALPDHPQRRAPAARARRPRPRSERASAERPLRILFIGQAVERKGLPVLLRAFEALREQVPATLTLVGAERARRSPT